MDIQTLNTKLAEGAIDQPGMFGHLDALKKAPFIFDIDFGLKALPCEPGILMIRGARQYGKSTWLEQALIKTVKEFGPGSAYYLNGENILTIDGLEAACQTLIAAFSKTAAVKRIFIDEITAIVGWEIALKRMADRRELEDVLVITTGSCATDLRRGSEKLPGRKGKLARTNYLFTPISYQEFQRVCGKKCGKKTFLSYLLSGGSPIACAELAANGVIPEYLITLVRDWVEGEVARSGRSRNSLVNIMRGVFRFACTPVGQAKLAREAGLSNNTVAHNYIELLNDLGCIVPAYPWDQDRKQLILRKPCKYHISNLLVALAYHPSNVRTIDDFLALPDRMQSPWYEWLVAQELQRRSAIEGTDILEPQAFWQSKAHEIDFVASNTILIEVKRGKTNPLEFAWFAQQFPRYHLTVVNQARFETSHVKAQTFEEFLLEKSEV